MRYAVWQEASEVFLGHVPHEEAKRQSLAALARVLGLPSSHVDDAVEHHRPQIEVRLAQRTLWHPDWARQIVWLCWWYVLVEGRLPCYQLQAAQRIRGVEVEVPLYWAGSAACNSDHVAPQLPLISRTATQERVSLL